MPQQASRLPPNDSPRTCPGEPGTGGSDVRFAAVNENGGLDYGDGAVSATGSSGDYRVTFAESAARCAAVATADGLDPVFATVTINGNQVTVRTYAGAALTPSEFYLVVSC
jgi:hypothetical protein